MRSKAEVHRQRVLVPQALGSDEFLRVTWHEERSVVVFSHWDGDTCVAALPARVGDLEALASLTAAAVADHRDTPGWPAPEPGALVVPAGGFVAPAERRSA